MLGLLLTALIQDPVAERLAQWVARPHERALRDWLDDRPAGYEIHRANTTQDADGRRVFEWSEESASLGDLPGEYTLIRWRFDATPPFAMLGASVEYVADGATTFRKEFPPREGYTLREFAWMKLRLPGAKIGEEFRPLRLNPWSGLWIEEHYRLEGIEERDGVRVWRIIEQDRWEVHGYRSVNWVDVEGHVVAYQSDLGYRVEASPVAEARAAPIRAVTRTVPLELGTGMSGSDPTGVLLVGGLESNPFSTTVTQTTGVLADGTVWVRKEANDAPPADGTRAELLSRSDAPDLRPLVAALWSKHGPVPEDEDAIVRKAMRILDRAVALDWDSGLDPVSALREQSANSFAHLWILRELLRFAGLPSETWSGLARLTDDEGVTTLGPRTVVRVQVAGAWRIADPVWERYPALNFYELEFGASVSWLKATTPEATARYVSAEDFERECEQ